MCLSTLYVDEAVEPSGWNICKVQVVDGTVIATDLMGREIRLAGDIGDIDLIENTIHVRTAAAG